MWVWWRGVEADAAAGRRDFLWEVNARGREIGGSGGGCLHTE